jgi:tetratricopeptide (TPR) repeat protein
MRSTTIALALLGSLCLHATAKPPAEPPTEPQHRPQLIELAASGASMQAYELGCSQLDELAQESRLELDKAGRFEFALIFTNALAMELAMSRDYAERLAALRDRPALRALPLLTAQLEHCRAQHLLRLGEGRAAAEIYDRLGAIQDVWMLGPLDNERGAGFRRTLPAEREAGQRGDALELDAPQRGKARELRWRRLDVGFSPARQFDFDALVRPNEQVLSLLMFAVRADTATPIAIRIGSGGSTTVRINGQQILERDAEERDFGFDQDQGCYVLSPGWNLVMVKTGCQEARYQLRMRMTSPSGELLPPGAVTISAKPEHLAEARKTAPSKESRPASALLPSLQLLPELQNASQLQGEARRAAAELAYRLSYLLNLADRDDESKRRDRALARLATELAPDWGAAWHLYGEALESGRWSADRDDNARFAAFERAVQTWPRALIAMLRLSMMELEGRGNRHKAVLWLERARAVQPRNRSVVRQELELFRARGMRDEYVVELRRALTDTQLSQDPELLDMAIAESIQEDRILEPLELARRRLALRNDPATHIRIASLLRRQGKYDEAKSQLETALALYPWDYDIFNALSQLHVARKDYRAAERSWSEYLELCPEEDHVWLELADLAARRGDRAAQISCLERALELRPGLSERARQLEYLQANEKPFYAGFELDGDEIIRKDEGASNRAKVDEESHEYLLQHTVIRAYADGTASRYEHLIARILNERGAELLGSYAAPFYGGSQTARILQARVIDPKGGERRARVGRSYYVNLPPIRPGDIVEIKARVDDRWPGFFGDYFGLEHVFVPEAGVGSKRQRLDVLLEQGREYYFQRVGGVPEAKERILQDGTRLRTWEMRHVASYDIESLAPSPRETGPLVRISTYRDWNQFAAWWWDLIRKQTTITPPIRARVQQLVQGVDDPEEKLRRIYEFVTNQVRYKAWEFGVHGYKPYSVDAIYARLHGDCKDKAILMNAMLSEVGIEAYPVLIEADERRERDD